MDRRRKLTEEQVREIRRRLEHETCMALGREFNVHHATISDIKQGTTWKRRQPIERSARQQAGLEFLSKVIRRNGGTRTWTN